MIQIEVKNKIAKVMGNNAIVANNSDYQIQFIFDTEWGACSVKTVRFAWSDGYIDVVINGDTVNMPAIPQGDIVAVGVYAGDIKTSTPAWISVSKSILDGEPAQADLPEDKYNQIIEMINDGMIKGEKGDSPVKGVDYWTQEDKKEIEKDVLDIVNPKLDTKVDKGYSLALFPDGQISPISSPDGYFMYPSKDYVFWYEGIPYDIPTTKKIGEPVASNNPTSTLVFNKIEKKLEVLSAPQLFPNQTNYIRIFETNYVWPNSFPAITSYSAFKFESEEAPTFMEHIKSDNPHPNLVTKEELENLGGGDSTDVQINGKSITEDGIANIPIATETEYGVIKPLNTSVGLQVSNGGLAIRRASNQHIIDRSTLNPIVPSNLDYAVKIALCDGTGAEWTETEKTEARRRMGIAKEVWTFTLDDGTVIEKEVVVL